LIHRLNLFLKPARGTGGPELTVGIYDDIYRIGVIACGKAAAGANAPAVLLLPVLLKSALSPLAVLLLPVVLFKSA